MHLFPMKHLSYAFKMLVVLTADITPKALVPFLKLCAQHLCASTTRDLSPSSLATSQARKLNDFPQCLLIP